MTKLKKFCSITKYLETIDKELHTVLDDLCLFGLFRSRGSGVTFLYPTNEAYRKKITKLAYGNTPEEAVDMIKALVLSDYLPKIADFGNKKDNIGNMLRKKLEVENVEKDTVLLKGGLKLKLDDKFVSINPDDTTVVYNLSGTGEISLKSADASVKYTQSKPRGGSVRGGGGTALDLAKWVEDAYAKQTNVKKNAYQAVMAYTYYLALQSNDKDDICKRLVAGMSAGARSSFYTIFSPYCDFKLSNLSPEFVKLCYEIKNDMDSCFESYPTFYKDYRTKVIIAAYAGSNIEESKEISKKLEEQKKLIKTVSPNEIVSVVKQQYKNQYELARDIFSVYNYLSLTQEMDGDNNYYTKCFLWVVRNVYKTASDITDHSLDLAHNMSIYGNLIRCDAYKYFPNSAEAQTANFVDLRLDLPIPTAKDTLFTIENNSVTAKHGGSTVRSVADLNAMMLGGLE
jgi:hypothetical protein